LPADVHASSFYSDPAHSVIDPERLRAFRQSTRPWRDAARMVEQMADRYRTDGDGSAASCTGAWLDRFARSGVLKGAMRTSQATYVQSWMLGAFAIAWLKVRTDPAITASQRARIADWLAQVASLNLRYYAARAMKVDGRNNLRYWAGLAVMAAGIAADRKDLFDWGSESFRIGVSQVTPEGSLPLEMARRARALHYHLFAAAPLVTMAELASANGVDLYHAEDGALVRLVRRAIGGIDDPSFFAERAGIAQEPVKLAAGDVGWAVPFVRRFPDSRLAALLANASSRSMLYLGGLPPP
jgi:poly(beta-D-mannuronate) lyase